MLGLILTFLKPFNTVLILWFISNGRNWLAAAAIMWLMVCDIFDGFLFRRSSLSSDAKISKRRRVLDIAGDRLAIVTVAVIIIIKTNIPFYLYGVEVIREIILSGIWLYSYRTKKPLYQPNTMSRISAFAVGLMAMAWLTMPNIAFWLLIPIIAFGTLGAIQYYQTITRGAR